MTSGWVVNEAAVRLGAFIGVLGLMLALEAIAPRRARVLPRLKRWATNLAIIGAGAVVVRVLAAGTALFAVPLVAVAAATVARENGIGLLNWLAAPTGIGVLVSVVALDFAVWLQHLLSHLLPPLWRLHQVHHADRDIDATTGLRFHPLEIALSMIYKVGWVVLLGAPAAGVIVFEIALNASAMFNHANWAMPAWVDRILRKVVVTPDMHRVHHSVHRAEHNSNYGFCLSVWDRWLGTYTAQPRDGHEGMTIGLPAFQTTWPASLMWSLTLPFSGAQPNSNRDASDGGPGTSARETK